MNAAVNILIVPFDAPRLAILVSEDWRVTGGTR
jgi:hypothetical protein